MYSYNCRISKSLSPACWAAPCCRFARMCHCTSLGLRRVADGKADAVAASTATTVDLNEGILLID